MMRVDRWALDEDEKQKIKAVSEISCDNVECSRCPLKQKQVCIKMLANYIVAKEEERI